MIEFRPALHLPDTGKRTCQRLCGTYLLLLLLLWLLLLLLRLLLLLLATCPTLLTHMISYLTRAH
jgi:hypothetical protein